MTQEEKAKAYDEAIERAKPLMLDTKFAMKSVVLSIFPELAESEDEKIRKEIVDFINHYQYNTDLTTEQAKWCKKAIAYLERQKDASKAIEAVERIDKYIAEHTANAHDMGDSNPGKKYYSGVDDTLSDISGILIDSYNNVDAAFDTREPRDNWEYIKEFCDKFGRMPKDMDELDVLVSYVMDKKQKEQKPVECSPNSVEFDEGFKTGREVGFREGVESVKPVEWSDSFEENIRNLLHDKLTWHSEDGSMSSTILIDDKTLKDIISGIWFYAGKEALKYPNKELNVTEWSEEDKYILKNIHDFVKENTINPNRANCAEECLNWLKSLPERFNPQPKQEWSEEVRKILDSIIDDYEAASKSFCGYAGKIWVLKAIRDGEYNLPKQEWNEEDESNLQWIISCVKGTNVYTSQELAKELTEWLKNKLKSLSPQPHTVSIKDATKFGNLEYERGVKDGIQSEKNHQWKPSEDQIKALTNLIKGAHPNIIPTDLSELLAKLKQLYCNG